MLVPLVLDEADEMLNGGFKEQVCDIYRYLPPSRQMALLLSATTRMKCWRRRTNLVKRLTLEGIMNQALLYRSGARAVEVRYLCYLYCHGITSGLVDPKDVRCQLDSCFHP